MSHAAFSNLDAHFLFFIVSEFEDVEGNGGGWRKIKGVRQSSRQSWLPTPMFKKNSHNTLVCTMYRYLSKCVNTIMMNYALNTIMMN